MNENETPENLKKSMWRYREVVLERATDKEISRLGHEMNMLQVKMDKACEKYDEELSQLEEYIEAQIMELERSVNHAGVQAKYTKGHIRTNYLKKPIEKILMDNPSLIPIFKPAKKETEVAPKVIVTYMGQPEAKESVAYSREDYEASLEKEEEAPF